MDIDRQDEQNTSVGFALAEMISDAGAFVLPFFPADSTRIDRFFQFTVFILYSFSVQIPQHPAGHTARQAQRAAQSVFINQTGTNTAKAKNRF